MPVVLSIVADPPLLMKHPATVPLDVIEKPWDGLTELPDDAAPIVIDGREPEYVGAFASPTSNQPP